MHAVEKASANERNLVDDQENDVFPLLLEDTELFALQLLFERSIRENAEGRACGFGTEPYVEGCYAGVCSELHGRFNAFFLEEEPQMLQDRPQSGGLPRTSRATQVGTRFNFLRPLTVALCL